MKCRKCGAEMPDGVLYCSKCGANIKRQASGIYSLFTKKMLPIWLGVLAAVALVVTGIFVIPGLLNETPNNPDPGNQDAAQIIERMKDLEDDFGFENALSELTEKSISTIDGDTYYRMQQNYNGIPVYGRTVVCATDENGETIAVTGNVWDVDENLNLSPTISSEQVREAIDIYLSNALRLDNIESLERSAINEDNLCIYNMTVDKESHLAYEISVGMIYLIIDAHDATVLHTSSLVNDSDELKGYMASDVLRNNGFEIELNNNSLYELSDTSRRLSVYTLNGTSSDNTLDHAIRITSDDTIFGNSTEEIALEAEKGAQLLLNTAKIHDWFCALGFLPAGEKTLLFYNDSHKNGASARGGFGPVPFPALGENGDAYGLVLVGATTGVNDFDVIAHEYTHRVSRQFVNWADNSTENCALNEAISDIFGELVEPLLSQNMDTPDWKMDGDNISVYRNIANPREHGFKENIEDTYTGSSAEQYGYATVISHAAYVMWRGIDDDPTTRLTTDELAKLWYRAMLMMPSDCNFAECRTLVELAGESMHLSDEKMQCIRAAFDSAGIPDERDVDYKINKNTKLSVYGIDSELYDNYLVKVEGRQWHLENYKSLDTEKIGFPVNIAYLYQNLTKEYSNVIETSSVQPMDLNLPEGTYSITLCDQADNSKTFTFRVSVAASGGKDKLDLYTDFGVLQTQKRLSCIKEYRDGQLYRSQYLHYDEQTGLLERNKIVQELEDDNYLYGETFNYTYEYDELNRLVKWSSLPGLYNMPTLEFIYDDNGRLSAWKHNKRDPLLGNLEGKCFYDDSGRLIQTVGKWDVHTETTEYKYNEFGLLTEAIQDSTVFDGDSVLQYQYDSQNRVSLVTTTDQYGTNTEKYIYDYYPIVLITGAYGEYEYTYACYDLGYLSNMNPHLAHRYFTLICVSDHSNPDRFSADEDGYLKNIEGTEYGAGRHVVKYEYIWEEIGSPHKETTTPPEDEAKMYTQYLLNEGYEELLTMDADTESLEISSCLADIDEDGVKELLISVRNMNVPISTHSALLDIVNGNVSIMVQADDWGGSMGGDKLRFRKDSKTHKHVLEFCGYMRDGQFKGDNHSNIYSISFDSYNVEYSFESIWTYIGEGALDEYVEQARKIADKYYEIYSYYDDEDYFFTYKIDGQYVSEEGYEAAMARFVDPDEAYTLKPVTYDNPIP